MLFPILWTKSSQVTALHFFFQPTIANVILSMEPVFAALCARLLLGETTSLEETLGGGLILAAALIATR